MRRGGIIIIIKSISLSQVLDKLKRKEEMKSIKKRKYKGKTGNSRWEKGREGKKRREDKALEKR